MRHLYEDMDTEYEDYTRKMKEQAIMDYNEFNYQQDQLIIMNSEIMEERLWYTYLEWLEMQDKEAARKKEELLLYSLFKLLYHL